MKHKYPIGTRIKYKGCVYQDVGKKGTIVRYGEERVWIILENSHVALTIYEDSEHEWCTHIENLEILAQKNEQLLFDFMYR